MTIAESEFDNDFSELRLIKVNWAVDLKISTGWNRSAALLRSEKEQSLAQHFVLGGSKICARQFGRLAEFGTALVRAR